MRVKSTRNKTISILAYCRNCERSLDMTQEKFDATKARSKVRNHVAKTGHTVEIYTERYCVYKPEKESEE